MHPSLNYTAHRPWPLPDRPWAWRQKWQQLAFIHYRIDAAALASRIPAELTIQEFDGSAWLAIVPFMMADVMKGNLPCFPPFRSFPELNVRTYVECNGRPGVWFLSLDADCWPVVLGGRVLYGLPYHKAAMRLTRTGEVVDFESRRMRGGAGFRGSYRPVGPVFTAGNGTFEHWATERYCLYSRVRGSTHCVDVHHRPWPLQRAAVNLLESGMFSALNLNVADDSPRCHFSSGVEVVSYPSYRVKPAPSAGPGAP